MCLGMGYDMASVVVKILYCIFVPDMIILFS